MVVSWACLSVVDRFQEFWYRFLGPTVLVVTGTVGWQVEVEAGKGAAGHGTEAATRRNKKTDGPDSGCSLWFVLCCCNHEKKR